VLVAEDFAPCLRAGVVAAGVMKTRLEGTGRHAAGAGWLRNACTGDMSPRPEVIHYSADPILL